MSYMSPIGEVPLFDERKSVVPTHLVLTVNNFLSAVASFPVDTTTVKQGPGNMGTIG